MVPEPYSFCGAWFDEYSWYVVITSDLGYSCLRIFLTILLTFSTSTSLPDICSDLPSEISQIRDIQARFNSDAALKQSLKDTLVARSTFCDRKESYSNCEAEVDFIIFAARRSQIDASEARRRAWSRLRREHPRIVVKTYDYLIDAFQLDSRSSFLDGVTRTRARCTLLYASSGSAVS
jgi:hypothetical protein